MAPKVGILGSGDVAQSLGKGFARHKWEVRLGSRTPKSEKLTEWRKAAGPGASVGTFAEAAGFGDVVIVATHGAATEAVLDAVGPSAFRGKLVIDVTNPLDFSKGMPPGLLVGMQDSMGERVQRKLPDAHMVKCFNTVAHVQMVDPKFSHGDPPMMICGNDAASKKRVTEMLKELGWKSTIGIGSIDGARWLEALVPLWVRVGGVLGTWNHAFQPVT
jgi:8-hydroxy-5-deazaflavin:NADPH oxidoreductase